MPKFQVTTSFTTTTVYEVEADTVAQAGDIYPKGRVVSSEVTTPTVDHVTLAEPTL